MQMNKRDSVDTIGIKFVGETQEDRLIDSDIGDIVVWQVGSVDKFSEREDDCDILEEILAV